MESDEKKTENDINKETEDTVSHKLCDIFLKLLVVMVLLFMVGLGVCFIIIYSL